MALIDSSIKELRWTGFERNCPTCGARSEHILSMPSPRIMAEGSIKKYWTPRAMCMQCATVYYGKEKLSNPEEYKKERNERIKIFAGVGVVAIFTIFFLILSGIIPI